jgi:hypothetical protein
VSHQAVRAVTLALALCLPGALGAQGTSVPTGTAPGAVLRTLDKVTGSVIDIEMASGQTMGYGTLEITLSECRFPLSNPAGDAFAYITVLDASTRQDIFQGWMVASSPALMALDHARYDVWVLGCITS